MTRFHAAVVLPGERPRPFSSPPIPPDPLAALTPEQRRRLPNLIGIGAAKCGTSALHAYLAVHPEIGMSEAKELQHFGTARWLDDLPRYAEAFDPDMRVRGETSPTYAMDPFVGCVPEQMAAVLPEPRFLFMVGDPVRRAVAHFREHRSMTIERRTLKEALADLDNPLNPYVAASRYGHQLARYLAVFPRERILVVDQDDLRARRRETLAEIFAFAGVDAGFWSPAFEAEPNSAADKIQPNRLGRWILDRYPRRRRVARKWIVRPLTATSVKRIRPDDTDRARLIEALRDDIARFRALTGRSFESWPV